MKKMYWIALSICILVFAFFGGQQLINYFKNVKSVNSYYSVENASSANLDFQRSREKSNLLNSYIKINSNFIENSNDNPSFKSDKKITNCYLLSDYFSTFKTYYSARLKLERAIFEEFPSLYEKINHLSDNELEIFFDSNADYLDKYFGITTFEKFKPVALALSSLKNSEFSSSDILQSTVTYNPYANSVIFRLSIADSEDNLITFSVNVYITAVTNNQSSPVIVFSSPGGVS